VGGWDLHELRTLQDWTVRYHLQSAAASRRSLPSAASCRNTRLTWTLTPCGPHHVTLEEVSRAVRHVESRRRRPADRIERVEYLIRARGFIQKYPGR